MNIDDSSPSPAHNHNRQAWNSMVRSGGAFTRPVSDRDLADLLNHEDGPNWLDDGLQGKRVLCLAAGGGRQSALYAAAGAHVTVVDISSEMLELDRQVANERKLDVQTVETSMDDLSMLQTDQFDMIIQPVSSCYVPDIAKVYGEVARVLRASGIYISQHKQPTNLQASLEPSVDGYVLLEPYYRSGPLPPAQPSRLREQGTLEFLHRWEQMIGQLCRSGFVIEDLVEPLHANRDAAPGQFGHRSQYIAPYVLIKARRVDRHRADVQAHKIWTA